MSRSTSCSVKGCAWRWMPFIFAAEWRCPLHAAELRAEQRLARVSVPAKRKVRR